MSTFRLSTFDSSEPLPDSFSPELKELDSQLAEMFAASQVSAGLAERVFAASVADLPRQQVSKPRLRLVGVSNGQGESGRKAIHWQSWGRVALAASVAIAAVVAVAVTRPKTIDTQTQNLVAIANSATHHEIDFAALNHWPEGTSGQWDNSVSHWIDSKDITADDVTFELASLNLEYSQ